MRLICKFMLLVFCVPAYAGGSHEYVELLQFAEISDFEYLLVVKPTPGKETNYVDPHIGKCEIFTVLGRFEKKGLLEGGYIPPREKFDEALAFLKTKPKRFLLGWMGAGFKRVNLNEPCVVISRSLELYGKGKNAQVISWYSGT